MIAISIINSALIFVALKGLEVLTGLRKVGKVISVVFLTGVLGFYYYVILSIVSGK